ncbi:MAG TPA: cupin domain-containing protein [Sphingomicrobium sp.]
MRKLLLITAAALLAGSTSGLQAKSKAMKWMEGPPGLPAGSTFTVVSGDPGKKGMFTIRARLPADYAVPAHWHPTNERVTVLSGKLHYGMSDKLDMAKAKTLAAGHSVTMTAKMNHWVHAPVATTIQVSGRGPFQITYVDPKDDPRKK